MPYHSLITSNFKHPLVNLLKTAKFAKKTNRPLTEEGRQDVEKVAKALKSTGVELENIFFSDKLRAVQTGEIFGGALNWSGACEQRQGLHAKDDVEACHNQLLGSASGDTMLVGHQPFMGKLASLLVTGSTQKPVVDFQKGCVVCLEKTDDDGYLLEWMIVPHLV